MIAEISVDEKYATTIETTEEAVGDEVCSNTLKLIRKSGDVNELDEERV